MNINEQMNKILETAYPTARPGFIRVLVDALDLHSKKNADYNGLEIKECEKGAIETFVKMMDVRRKYSRLHRLIIEEQNMKVDEQLEDTAIDLGVYAFLLTEQIRASK